MRAPNQMLQSNLIVSHLAGSHAYGTNIATSDTDVRGIFFVDKDFYMSPWHQCGEVNVVEEADTKYYELSKFMTLLVDQNPNIVESLWVRPEDVTFASPAYDKLRNARYELLSSKCKFTYSGYAYEQLKRIKGHERWLANPKPEQPPRQIDYVSIVHDYFTNGKLLRGTQLVESLRVGFCLVPFGQNIFGLYQHSQRELFADDGRFLLNRGEPHWFKDCPPHAILKFNEQEYQKDLTDHTNYWNWRNNRNVARSELEQKYGYDTKHAMHLVRLLRTGYEILTEGVVNVYRPDAKELLEIREGKYSYEGILEYAAELEAKVGDAYKRTALRKTVNVNHSAELLQEILEECWSD